MEIKSFEIRGEVYYPASATAEMLGFSNPRRAIVQHCEWRGGQGVCKEVVTNRAGKRQEINLIDRVNFWLLVFASTSALGRTLRLNYLKSNSASPEMLIQQNNSLANSA